jgi:hypothetical protein
MALKPFNSVGGFSVGANLTPIIDANGSATFTDITATGNIRFTSPDFDLSGDADIGGNLQVDGSTNLGDVSVNGTADLVDLNASGQVVLNGVQFTGQQIIASDSSFEILGNDQGVQLQSLDSANSTFTIVFADNTGAGLVTDAGEITLGTDGNVTATGSMSVGGDLSVTGSLDATSFSGDAGGLSNITGANVVGQVSDAASADVALSVDLANVVGIGNVAALDLSGDASQYLNGAGQWAILDTDTLANGTSNVSIDAIDGPVTIGVDGVANVAVFTSTDRKSVV